MPLGAFKLNLISKAIADAMPAFNTITATGGTISDVKIDNVWYRIHEFKHRISNIITGYGNAQHSTAQSKFGSSSALFDGTDDYLSIPDSDNWNLTTTNAWTFECWIYPTTLSVWQFVAGQQTSGTQNGWSISISPTAQINFADKASSSNVYSTTASGLVINTWQHISIVRNSTTLKMYVNGVEKYSNSSYTTSGLTSSDPLLIGSGRGIDNSLYLSSLVSFNGYIDELRISKTARYTAAFTPSATAFVNDSDTLLLCHFTGLNASTTFIDDNTGGTTDYTFSVTNLGSSNGVVDLFNVGGGGGGGAHDGLYRMPGGGGGGGIRLTKGLLKTGNYTIKVGGGGTGGIGRGAGISGSNSTALSVITVGGGGGGYYYGGAGSSGGSGGGGGTTDNSVNAGGSGITGQGYSGGVSNVTDVGGGGGGGGAGSLGQSGGTTLYYGGNGGAGVDINFNGISLGYSGGGGGAGYSVMSATGGLATHNGGNGGAGTRGSDGTTDTGAGGGGGNGQGYVIPSGGNGGSGIVMIRYPINSANNITAGTLEAVQTVASSTSTSSTIAIPSSAMIDDYAILFDFSTSTTLTVPSGFTQITTSTTTGIRSTVSYRKLTTGQPGTTITGMAGTTSKVLLIVRGNTTINSITISTPTQQATTAAPTNQTISMSGQAAPIMGFAHYTANAAVTTRNSDAISAVTTEYNAGINQYVKTFAYNAYYWTPTNVVISTTDVGTNALQSFYIRFA